MLSKKMAFSLMSLITLLALAFVAPTAMAGEFGVAVDVTGDIGSADGLQVEHPGTSLVVTVKFDQAVLFDATKAFVTAYDKKGKLVDIPVATGAPAKTVASKEITLTIPVTADVAKVNIKIAKGIGSADPINADTSKALDVNIFLLGTDAAANPAVYSIRRADNPLLPATAATVQVIVTLSEEAKEFKKGNLSISDNATISKEPEALDPIPAGDATTAGQIAEATLATKPPPTRGLYTPVPAVEDDPDTEINESMGIHEAINDNEDYVDPGSDAADDAGA